MTAPYGILRFHEQYFERIWGGRRLRSLFGKPAPEGVPIGEAWLISDHPSAPSIVSEGPNAGRSLHDLVEEDPVALLGSREYLTPYGRFPLLLKLLDSEQALSVQVHPDNQTAVALGEPDIGKTEMWFVIHAEPDAELIVGLEKDIDKELARKAISAGNLENYLLRRRVKPGDSVFVEAGTVHAIGGGIVLAEIQQNSDLTYRLYDWNRVDANGKGRELHIEKGLSATKLSAEPVWNETALTEKGRKETTVFRQLSVSDYFVTTHVRLDAGVQVVHEEQFLIVLSLSGDIVVSSRTECSSIKRGSCILIPACEPKVTLTGNGEVLLYSPKEIGLATV